jgi:hypothetical protein
MRVEFHRPGDPEEIVGTARWDGRRAHVEADDEGMRESIARVFRLSPVVVEDPSLRPMGTRGETVLQPGSVEWFRAAALSRAAEAGLVARVVPEVSGQGGWDPASAYRTFRETVQRIVTRPEREGPAEPQPGEARPADATE